MLVIIVLHCQVLGKAIMSSEPGQNVFSLPVVHPGMAMVVSLYIQYSSTSQ